MIAAPEKEKTFDFQLDEFYLDLQEDGRRISILSPEQIVQMPFPGLRPFKTSEFQLYRGRDGQAEELLKRLRNNRFLAVIGSSGTGKSSLVRAGLIPQLFGGYLHEAGDRWKIAICRPGKNPVANLAIALSSAKGESGDKELLFRNYETIEPMLNQSLYGLLDVHALLNEDKEEEEQSNLLVIVDQFEELFRYDRKDLGSENIENYFVDLLLKAASNRKTAVYVIITMRSEFLGDCVKHRGLPEAINEGQYLVPGLNRTQLKEVIEAPIHLAGKDISPNFVELLINEIEENKLKENLDQLPILQHALMRTYQRARQEGAQEITYEHYEAVGKMKKALANHAKEKFDELQQGCSPETFNLKQQIAKIVFQSLTDASTDLKGGRRPTELRYIQGVAESVGAGKIEVNEVVDRFRDNNTSFIMPPANTALHDELILDISHESLMRNWDLLKGWAEEEVRNGRLYQKINERRADNDLRMPELLLREMLDWRNRFPHNAVWASRYHLLPQPTHDLAVHEAIYRDNIRFLDDCQKLYEEEKETEQQRQEERLRLQREEDMRRQKEKSQRRTLSILSAGFFIALLLATWAFRSRSQATQQKNKALVLAAALGKQKKLAEASQQLAVVERDRANALAQKVVVQRDSLRIANESIEAKKDRAIRLQNIIAVQNARLAKQKQALAQQIVERKLHESNFYKSPLLDDATKEEFVEALFKSPQTLHEEVVDADFINVELLKELNAAINARELFLTNPVASLRDAERMWKEKKMANSMVRRILSPIFERNNFPAQRISSSVYESYEGNGEPSLLSTGSNEHFAFADFGRVVTGRYAHDSLRIDRLIWPAAGNSDSPAEDAPDGDVATFGESAVMALNFTGPNTLLSLDKSGTVNMFKNDQRIARNQLGKINPWMAAFSPSGKWLVDVSQDGALELWNMDSLKRNSSVRPDLLSDDGRNRTIRQLILSPDDRFLLTQFTDNRFEIWDLTKKSRSDKFGRSRNALAVNFTNEGNNLVVVPAFNNIRLVDSLGRVPYSKQLFRDTKDDDGVYVDRISDVALSSDWKSILVNAGGNLHLFETVGGDSLFKTEGSLAYLTSKKLSSPRDNIKQANFLNPQEVVAISTEGAILRWNKKASYPTIQAALEAIQPVIDSTYEEKVLADPAALDKVLSSSSESELREAAAYYFDRATSVFEPVYEREKALQKASQLYLKLHNTDGGYLRQIDSVRLHTLENTSIEAVQRQGFSPDETLDTANQIIRLQESVKDGEQLLALQGNDANFRDQLSTDYWNLSWYLLFSGQYDGAVKAARRSLDIFPQNDGVVTNLALGYLLKGDFPAAEAVYQKYKDRYYSSKGKNTFRTSFLQDFRDLEKAGVITKDNLKVYQEMLRIKAEILGSKE